MIEFGVQVSGGRELAARLNALAAGVRGPLLAAALEAGALHIQNEAKAQAPYRTGTLRRSLHTERVSVPGAIAAVAVGTDVPYARRIEYGFSGADSRGRVYHQPPRPYLRPAFDARRAAAVAEVQRVLAKLVAGAR